MKTIIFSLCWLGEPWRIIRYQKWLSFQLSIQKELGFERIILVDNASNIEDLKLLNGNIIDIRSNSLIHRVENSVIDIYRYEKHIPRTGIWEYPYCWRGLEWLKNYLYQNNNVDKVIGLDSDFYILTSKMSDYSKDLNKGWVSFFCHKYGFPEAALHILCKDSFHLLLNFPIPSYTHYNNQHMEWLLPFTHVDKTIFKGDRYGETTTTQDCSMDWYGQWDTKCPDMVFNLTKDIV